LVVDCVIADIKDITDDSQSSSEYLTTSVNSVVRQDRDEYLTAIDSCQWKESVSYLTSVDDGSANSAEQYSGSSEVGRHMVNQVQRAKTSNSDRLDRSQSVDVCSSTTRTGSGRQSSALKLNANVAPQEHVLPNDYNPDLLSKPMASDVGVLAQERTSLVNKPSSPLSHSSTGRPSPRSRTLSNEPLGAEFDVKQIKVRRAENNPDVTSTRDPFDFFADMAPVIASSSSSSLSSSVPQKSLLGLLSAAAAEALPAQLTSQLNVTDEICLDSSVSSNELNTISNLSYKSDVSTSSKVRNSI